LDIEFLEEVFRDTQQYRHFVDEHPEFQKLYATVAHLYDEIAKKALDNENKSQTS
jgi:DNA-binding ferritin-like protein